MSAGLTSTCLVAGGLLGAAAVATGAFGAHGLAGVLEASGQAANWDTASRYALFHALATVATGLAAGLPAAANARRGLATAAACFVAGTLIFSGCLWILALTGVRILGAVVPIGGTLMIAGWLILARAAMRFDAADRP